MNDVDKTKEQLRAEVAELRRRISELEAAAGNGKGDRITPQDNCDPITGLPSRRLFDQHLSVIAAQTPGQVRKFALMFLGIDRFDDERNFDRGEMDHHLLQGVANRLKILLRESDIVTRSETDDFLILLSDVSWMGIYARIVPRILNSFKKPFLFDDRSIRITVNIGVALYPDNGRDGGALVEYSRIAMQRAVKEGPNSCQFYGARINGDPGSVRDA